MDASPGSIHDQAGRVFDQSDLVGVVPAYDKRVGIDDLYWLHSTKNIL